jgi:hypothetical protein
MSARSDGLLNRNNNNPINMDKREGSSRYGSGIPRTSAARPAVRTPLTSSTLRTPLTSSTLGKRGAAEAGLRDGKLP